ncbi:MAG: hypothetical protein WAP91_04595 [Bacilli bacterium]
MDPDDERPEKALQAARDGEIIVAQAVARAIAQSASSISVARGSPYTEPSPSLTTNWEPPLPGRKWKKPRLGKSQVWKRRLREFLFRMSPIPQRLIGIVN